MRVDRRNIFMVFVRFTAGLEEKERKREREEKDKMRKIDYLQEKKNTLELWIYTSFMCLYMESLNLQPN